MAFARTAFWRSDETTTARLRRNFWRKLRRVAAQIPFAEDLLAAYYCAFDHDTPLPVKATLIARALPISCCRSTPFPICCR